jgi:hypothetical protein
MINEIAIRIAYPIKVGFFSINLKKKVTFRFDNLAMHLFREKQKIEAPEQLAEWRKAHNEYDALIHVLFASAESYCMEERKPFKLDLKRFAMGFAQADKEAIDKVIKTMQAAESFGFAATPGKKKVTAKV